MAAVVFTVDWESNADTFDVTAGGARSRPVGGPGEAFRS
jgi:hypothetical protein